MANTVLQGIMGRYGGFGNGAGGNIALSIKEEIMRFLSTDHILTYMVSARKPDMVGVGTVAYRKIQTLQNERYFGSNNAFQEPQADFITVNLDKAMVCKWKYETFNMSRVQNANDLISQVAATVYESMRLQLNAALLMFLKYHILGDEQSVKAVYPNVNELPQASGQFTKVTTFGKTQAESGLAASAYGDAIYQDYMTIRDGITRIGQIYSKESFGVRTTELMSVVSPIARNSLSGMGRNQVGGTISNFQIKNVSGTELEGLSFYVDNMLDNTIASGQSFNKNYDIDLRNVVGFMLHNEAVALPLGEIKAWEGTDPNDGNWYFGVKWMYGIGLLRKQLVWAYVKENETVNVNDYFITNGTTTINRTFDNNIVNGDFTANRFASGNNPSAFDQPAFIRNPLPNENSTITGAATGKTETNPEPQSLLDGIPVEKAKK